MIREDWLNHLVDKLRPLIAQAVSDEAFKANDNIRVSTAFPSSGGLKRTNRVMGECWERECATDGSSQIFINPTVDSGYDVARYLLHEMCHTATPNSGHKGRFVKLMKAVGFVKPFTQSNVGPDLELKLRNMINVLPPYPHAALHPKDKKKKQGTRMLKLECDECGMILRASKKWIDAKIPLCINGHDSKEFIPIVEESEESES